MEQASTQVEITLQQLPKGHHLFKIFGHLQFSFEKDSYSKTPVDWSGFYTQLHPEHSLRYLTKKWDDGADYACLVLFQPLNPIKILKVQNNKIFSDPKISGQQKAQVLKQTLNRKSTEQKDFEAYKSGQDDRLINFLGERTTLMQCVDMQDNQIIIPHSILNSDHFTYQVIISFKKSTDGLLRTVSWCDASSGLEQPNWITIKGQCQYEPYLLLKESPQIQQIISKLASS